MYAVILAELILTAFFIDKKNVWSVPEEDKVIDLNVLKLIIFFSTFDAIHTTFKSKM